MNRLLFLIPGFFSLSLQAQVVGLTTMQGVQVTPRLEITTNEISNNTGTNSVLAGGNITNLRNVKVTGRGLCWSTSPAPAIDDANDFSISSGTTAGAFTTSLPDITTSGQVRTGLNYYLRAYVTTASGATFYGEEKKFAIFAFTGVLQYFTVPTGVTSVTINALGAQGGDTYNKNTGYGGRGASMRGTFAVSPGEVLTILAGGVGGSVSSTSYFCAGGGGGTFITRNSPPSNPMLVAGGGAGGMGNPSYGINGGAGQITLNGGSSAATPGSSSSGAITPGGSGGNGGRGYYGGGGGGWLTNATPDHTDARWQGLIGKKYPGAANPGYSGGSTGGYGGGGAGDFFSSGGASGGGGGYSGGSASSIRNISVAGGGGSYNAGTDQANFAGDTTYGQYGSGKVIIIWN